MTTPSRALTNDYNDRRLIMLDANDPRSPLVLVREGYAPSDPSFRMRMFYHQHDGFWIDEIATAPSRIPKPATSFLKPPTQRSRPSPGSLENRSSATAPRKARFEPGHGNLTGPEAQRRSN